MGIYIAKNGQQLGPYRETELVEKCATGAVDLTDLAWSEGEVEWKTLAEYAAQKSIQLTPVNTLAAPQISDPISAPPPKVAPAPPPPIKDAWFVQRKGEEFGPYTKDAMRQYLTAGNLVADDQVRHEDEQIYRLLSSVLPKPTVDLNAMAGKAAGIISDIGGKSADMAAKAMINAGPLGEKLKEKTKGKEKLIFGGVGVGVLALGLVFMLPGGPSSGDITQAMERQFVDAGIGPGGARGASVKISNLKKLGCKNADQGGYYCHFEYDYEVAVLGVSQKDHQTGSARFVKDSKGWAAIGG